MSEVSSRQHGHSLLADSALPADRSSRFGPGRSNTAGESLLRARFSTRAFTSETVDDSILDQVLSLANSAPSWCNTQPWGVYVLTGEALTALSERFVLTSRNAEPAPDIAHPESYAGAHLDRRRAAGYGLYQSAGIDRADREARAAQAQRNFRFFDAPCALIVTAPRYLGPYALVDIGAYLTGLQLAAQCFGLGSIAQAALSLYPAAVRSVAPIPEDEAIVCGVSLGYPDPTDPVNAFVTERDNAAVKVGEPHQREYSADASASSSSNQP